MVTCHHPNVLKQQAQPIPETCLPCLWLVGGTCSHALLERCMKTPVLAETAGHETDTADWLRALPDSNWFIVITGFSVMFWSTLQSSDRDIIRWSLAASAVYFIIQILGQSIHPPEVALFFFTRSYMCSTAHCAKPIVCFGALFWLCGQT